MSKSDYRLKPYRSPKQNSGVTRYALGPDYIVIEFKSTAGYRYDSRSPGRRKVQIMKKLAQQGSGLATFINQNVHDNYAEKLW